VDIAVNRDTRSRFAGKVVIVTGGNAGIGLAAARAFAREGGKVLIAARRRAEGEAAVAQIEGDGGVAAFVEADVTDADSVRNMVAACIDRFGALDVAFNNAGITGEISAAIPDADETEFDRVMAVNVKGTWLCLKYELAEMLKRGGGVIVNCGSTAAIRGGAGRAGAYYASKHAIMGLTKQAAMEGATRNVRVNAVLPGMTMTEIIEKGFAADQDKARLLFSRIPMARAAQPDEIASAVLWLASDESSYATGIGVPVDGGVTI
jgi:NAD(P)-dependent dehydrogenase (short-subunit alcohol dehydrogenase family)